MHYEFTAQQSEFQTPDDSATDRSGSLRDLTEDKPNQLPEDRSEYGAETREPLEINEDTEKNGQGEDLNESPEIPEDTASGPGEMTDIAPEIPEDTALGPGEMTDIAPEIPEDTALGPEDATDRAPEIPEDTVSKTEDTTDEAPEILEDTVPASEYDMAAPMENYTAPEIPEDTATEVKTAEASGEQGNEAEYAEIGGWKRSDDIPSAEEALSETNPDFDEGEEWQVNCQRCVPTYEMRRRGYDVSAQPCLDDLDKLSLSPFDVWEDPEIISCTDDDRNTLVEEMSQWEDGARAQVVVMWENGEGGHTFIAEKVDGEIRFVDPQTGDTECSDYFDEVEPGSTQFCRIDNLKPSEKILECCKEA